MLTKSVLLFSIVVSVYASSDPKSNEKDHPYMVSLRTDGNIFSGGSIIAKRWILTVAHNLENMNSITILAGKISESDGKEYYVDKKILHENFTTKPLANDIALLKLKEEIEYNDNVNAINLPSTDTPVGVTLILVGWERDAESRRYYSETLREFTVTSESLHDCDDKFIRNQRRVYQVRGYMAVILESNICTVSPDDADLCQGDIVGALVRDEEIAGITSLVPMCPQRYPDIYTNVYKYLDWIKNKLKS